MDASLVARFLGVGRKHLSGLILLTFSANDALPVFCYEIGRIEVENQALLIEARDGTVIEGETFRPNYLAGQPAHHEPCRHARV